MWEEYFLLTFSVQPGTHMHTATNIYVSLCIYKYGLLLSSRSGAVYVAGTVQGRNCETENSCCVLVPLLAPWRNNMLLISRQ